MALSPCQTTTNEKQKELVEHGTIAFPIACYGDDLRVNTVPWHWHEEFEFAIVAQGTPEFLLENHRFSLAPGDGIFINSQALHAAEDSKEMDSALHSAVFHPRLIGGSMDSVFWQSFVQPFLITPNLPYVVLKPQIPWQKEVLDCFQNTWDTLVAEPLDFQNEIRYLLTKALRILRENCPTLSAKPSEQDLLNASRIRTMLEFIESHYNEDLTLMDIADTVSISDTACLRCFNQFLGTTPIQYVKQLRLEKSALLLRNTNKTAKEIALECGFNDISYFTKAFREKYNHTPKEYQKSHNPSHCIDRK